ncbi:MAG: hypothetical protein J6T64_09830 [Bacteroidaceae bacterium]|nr:hypothetical protein [Bacteroidaceae bacterium]
MKKFIAISLLAIATAAPALACGWGESYNYYLFRAYNPQEFRMHVNEVTDNNWKVYLGSNAEYFYFNADEVKEFARGKGDLLMVSYVENLEKYLECAEAKRYESWGYPTKEDLAQRKQKLTTVRAYALGKLKTRLRSQHALLYMRCNMMLGRHQENIQFWEQSASQYIESVYRDMMKNIYAGALLQTGKDEEAASIFAEQGDWESLMTQYYKRRSCQAIRQEYLRNPNSPVLPFLLTDFVNNSQEAIDAEHDALGGKLFIRDITKAEAKQMCQLATSVVSEGKTKNPVLWQSAKAWIEFMFGDHRQGIADIEKAVKMEGEERMKENARVLKLYMTAAEATPGGSFDDYLAQELEWIDKRAKEDNSFLDPRTRLVHQVLVNKYSDRPLVAVSLLKAIDSYEYNYYIDTVRVESLQQYIDYASTPAQTALDRYLKPHQKLDQNKMNDLVGTKYMRLCRWQEAAEWLARVPVSFYNERGYAVYVANRQWTVEPWITRQFLKDEIEYSDRKWQLKENPKLAFAREMGKMEGELNVLKGKDRQQLCYDLAVRYAQAHFTGDCWFLMRDGKSITDKLRCNETDLSKKAAGLLKEASQTKDAALKERALFAQCYGYLYFTDWQMEPWNSNEPDDPAYQRLTNPKSPQYQAFAALADFERSNKSGASKYVSNCDDYLQFRKKYQ